MKFLQQIREMPRKDWPEVEVDSLPEWMDGRELDKDTVDRLATLTLAFLASQGFTLRQVAQVACRIAGLFRPRDVDEAREAIKKRLQRMKKDFESAGFELGPIAAEEVSS
jgi:hypothetical protein